MFLTRVFVIFCILQFSSIAAAHPVAQGAMKVTIQPSGSVQLEVKASMEQLVVYAQETGADKSLFQNWKSHGNYLANRLKITMDGGLLPLQFRDGVPAPEDQSVLPGAISEQGFVRFDLHGTLPEGSARQSLIISQDLLNEFEFAAGNRWEVTLITDVFVDGSAVASGRLLTSSSPLNFSDLATSPPAPGSPHWRQTAMEFFHHGMHHILTGYDHLLFVAALVLAAATLWELIKVVTAFTLAHSLTMVLSSLDIVRVPSSIVEPMIAGSIVFIALQNVFAAQPGRKSAIIAFLFGLFHGLGYAGGLIDAMSVLDSQSVLTALAAFSIGVELAHQVVVIPLFLGLSVAKRVGKDWPVNGLLVRRVTSACIGLLGIHYLYSALESAFL